MILKYENPRGEWTGHSLNWLTCDGMRSATKTGHEGLRMLAAVSEFDPGIAMTQPYLSPGSLPLRLGLFALLLMALPSTAVAVELTDAQLANRRCYNCHAQEAIATMPPAQRRTMVAQAKIDPGPAPAARAGLLVSPDLLAGSTHGGLACVSCHADAQDLPHAQHLGPVSCNDGCHTQANAAYQQGAHAPVDKAQADNPAPPTCADCHGGHDILPSTNRQSRTYPLNVIDLCAEGHSHHTGRTTNGQPAAQFVTNYLDSVHGQALQSGGLVVAASCVDCHGAHAAAPSDEAASPVHRSRVAETCGQCHMGVADAYNQSIHGRKLLAGDLDAPVCTDCHTAHAITHSDTPAFQRDIINECGHCHNQPTGGKGRSLYETYRLSYHGQVTALGSQRAADCSDCHGAHGILPVDEPASRLHASNRIEVCRECHPGTSAAFAEFKPHADYRNPDDFALLYYVWLYFMIVISGTLTFFGLHSMLWFGRSLTERLKHGPHPRPRADPHAIQRFKRIDRINHAFVIITFFGLTLTGMPLLYSDQTWAHWLAWAFGGIEAAGIWHRIFAIMLIGNFVVHIAGVINRCRKHGPGNVIFGPNSMLPHWRDVKDLLAMFGWFFGGKRPTFDHWTYWEKFDYWAEIFGTFIIGGTGALLWLAADAPHLLPAWLPGWVFNLATIIHGYEALLAVAFIFTIHFFNAHLRMEKFPVDDVMFTGQLPEAEFAHERGSEYERAKQTGEIEKLRTTPAPPWQRTVAVLTGVAAMAIGTGIIVLIVLAGLGVL